MNCHKNMQIGRKKTSVILIIAAINTPWIHDRCFCYEEHNTIGCKGMLYLTRTPDLVVGVNDRDGMEVEKLVKETATNVIQRVYGFKLTKKA